jgi:hypothetical protein
MFSPFRHKDARAIDHGDFINMLHQRVPDGSEDDQTALTDKLPEEDIRNLVLHKQLLALHAYAFYGLPVAGPAVMTDGDEGIPDGADTRKEVIHQLIEWVTEEIASHIGEKHPEMRDQYAGDISDYLKFSFLRQVVPETHQLGIAWYYVT